MGKPSTAARITSMTLIITTLQRNPGALQIHRCFSKIVCSSLALNSITGLGTSKWVSTNASRFPHSGDSSSSSQGVQLVCMSGKSHCELAEKACVDAVAIGRGPTPSPAAPPLCCGSEAVDCGWLPSFRFKVVPGTPINHLWITTSMCQIVHGRLCKANIHLGKKIGAFQYLR